MYAIRNLKFRIFVLHLKNILDYLALCITSESVYFLQGKEGDEAISKALKNVDSFVLKPQREGGGWCVFFVVVANYVTIFINEVKCIIQIRLKTFHFRLLLAKIN